MNKKKFKISQDVSNEIERKFYIMKSYESLLTVLYRNYSEALFSESDKVHFESKIENARNMLEEYCKQYQKAQIEFSYTRDSLFYNLIGDIPSHYIFNFDKMEVECEW